MTDQDNEEELKTDRGLLDLEKGQRQVTFSDLQSIVLQEKEVNIKEVPQTPPKPKIIEFS